MERLKSLGNGLIIILLLVGTAVFAVVWPLVRQSLNFNGLSNLFGGATRPSVETAPIVITIPEPIASAINMNEIVAQGFMVFAVLAVVVIGSVVVAGAILTILMRLGGKFTGQVAESDEYQKHVVALEGKEKETLKAKRENAPDPSKPEGYIYGLDPVSFSLVVLFFLAAIATLIAAFAPYTVDITLFDETYTVNTLRVMILVLFIIAIPLLAWRVRRSRLDAIAENDGAPIPWDFITVLITGLLVVGVGIGIMIYINLPM